MTAPPPPTWQNGRELETFTNSEYSISYSYDVNGLRTEKAVTRSGVTTSYRYFYNGTTLLQERIGSDTVLNFIYTADGKPYALQYSTNGGNSYTTYYYLTNLQGDVVSLLDSNGTAVVTYSYDSFGALTGTAGSLAATLGADNPLRYRGYVLDEETGLYYLQSRYYDPQVGRFINADDTFTLSATPTELTNKNLFTYCDNNPVSRKDENGQFWHLVIGAVVGAVIGGVSAALNGGDTTDILIGAAFGAAGGLLAASGAGVCLEAAGSSLLAMGSNAAQQCNAIQKGTQEKFDTDDMLIDGVIGLAFGAWGGKGASFGNEGGINAAGKQLTKRILSGDNIGKAFSYYAKTAHQQGGGFVLMELGKSLTKSAIGALVSLFV